MRSHRRFAYWSCEKATLIKAEIHYFVTNTCKTRVGWPFTDIENVPWRYLTLHDVNIVTACVTRWRCKPPLKHLCLSGTLCALIRKWAIFAVCKQCAKPSFAHRSFALHGHPKPSFAYRLKTAKTAHCHTSAQNDGLTAQNNNPRAQSVVVERKML